MRVISGKFKHKRLYSPDDNRVRPTTDKIKETLFNILAAKGYIGEINALDLFGGTGGIGIEFLSRGAERVVFIDNDRDSLRLIKENLRHVGADTDSYEIYNADYTLALKKLCGRSFDVIFADPPYAAGFEQTIIERILQYSLLSGDGILVIEHSSDKEIKHDSFDLEARKCGGTMLSFLTVRREGDRIIE